MTRAVSPVDTKVEPKMDAKMAARDTPPSPAQKGEHKPRGRPFERGKSEPLDAVSVLTAVIRAASTRQLQVWKLTFVGGKIERKNLSSEVQP
jgi:hypothetical protein